MVDYPTILFPVPGPGGPVALGRVLTAVGDGTASWQPGASGTPGSVWFAGTGVPAGGLGVVGDFYLDSATGNYYKKTGASTWTLQGSLQGPVGATGAPGTNGSNGAPGSVWYNGTGAPGGGLGIVGDYYFDTASGNYYQKTGASTWTLVGNLAGAAGVAGTADEYGYVLPAGGFSSVPSRNGISIDGIGTASGTFCVTYFKASQTLTSTTVKTYAAVALTGTPSVSRIGLYAADYATGNLTSLIASTTHDAALWTAATTLYTKSWSSSVGITKGNWYALGLISVTSGFPPALAAQETGNGATAPVILARAPRLSGLLTGQANLPASATGASLADSFPRFWAEIT